jgi:hypothetical protein
LNSTIFLSTVSIIDRLWALANSPGFVNLLKLPIIKGYSIFWTTILGDRVYLVRQNVLASYFLSE